MDITKMSPSEIKDYQKKNAAEKRIATKVKKIEQLARKLKQLNDWMGKNENKIQKVVELNAKFKQKAEETAQKLAQLGRE